MSSTTHTVAESIGRHVKALDALHLAAALDLGDDLDGVITYDERLADAVRSHGVLVVAPA